MLHPNSRCNRANQYGALQTGDGFIPSLDATAHAIRLDPHNRPSAAGSTISTRGSRSVSLSLITKRDPVENCGRRPVLTPVLALAVETSMGPHASTSSLRPTRRGRKGILSLGFDPLMKSTPAPPVDRIERTVNPFVLAILVLCLLGAVAAIWLAPRPTGLLILSGVLGE